MGVDWLMDACRAKAQLLWYLGGICNTCDDFWGPQDIASVRLIAQLIILCSIVVACAGMGIDWLMDTWMAKAQLLWVGLFCFSLSTFLGTLAHVARLKAIKAHRCAMY